MRIDLASLAAVAVLTLAAPAIGQAQTVTHAQQEANKKLVLEFYRNVWEPQRLDAMKDYYDENIIEHNPNVKNGIAGFAETMGRRWVAKPVQPALKDPPVMVTTDGDLVTLIFKRARPEPSDATKTYDAYWFDMFRIKNGKVVEHWDAATKPVRPPTS